MAHLYSGPKIAAQTGEERRAEGERQRLGYAVRRERRAGAAVAQGSTAENGGTASGKARGGQGRGRLATAARILAARARIKGR
jgi:hypothetical protein